MKISIGNKLQLNLSTTANLGTEESGHSREVLNKSQCMDFLSARTKKKWLLYRDMAIRGGSTVDLQE